MQQGTPFYHLLACFTVLFLPEDNSFHLGAAVGTLVVLLLLPLSLEMEDGEFDHGGGGGGGGGPVAAAAAAVAAMDEDWRQKRPSTRASTVA